MENKSSITFKTIQSPMFGIDIDYDPDLDIYLILRAKEGFVSRMPLGFLTTDFKFYGFAFTAPEKAMAFRLAAVKYGHLKDENSGAITRLRWSLYEKMVSRKELPGPDLVFDCTENIMHFNQMNEQIMNADRN